jgi:hypothetical protein
MNGSSDLGTLTPTGTNLLAYINSIANFTLPTSGSNTNQSHKVTITGLDLAKNVITLLIESTPQTITLNLNETSNIDLDQDNKPDVSIKFAGLFVNRAELTIKPLIINSPLATTLVTSSTSATTLVPMTPKFTFKRDLKSGMTNVDVKALQKFLNANGFIIAKTGAGSPGKETTLFGSATRSALIKFQKANKITPAVGYFGAVTRRLVNSK